MVLPTGGGLNFGDSAEVKVKPETVQDPEKTIILEGDTYEALIRKFRSARKLVEVRIRQYQGLHASHYRGEVETDSQGEADAGRQRY